MPPIKKSQRVGSARRKKRSSKQSKKVDLTACPKFAGKKEIVDFVSQWGEFSNVYLQRKYLHSTEEWRSNIIVVLNKAGSNAWAFRRDVKRWRWKRMNPEDIVEKMKQEYSSTLLAMQLAVQERVQVFPWFLDHRDRNGRVVIPSGVVLSFAKIDQGLEDLLLDSNDAEWEIADPSKVIMIINALTDDQRMKLVNSLRSKLSRLEGQLDLRQIDYATLKKELEWFASFNRDAEIKARQRQSGGRERAFRGQQRWSRGSGGFKNQGNR
uniref:Uncharacterized protein n=1 Tax=Chromera velia CCMP2878 TaxID=1169474 RepID=A0A0G4ID37_9ALVE|eukprot:Cvel_13222.t1-p1 / transcript=Cvel_13222.t1 / gene=Cvel_13222 / organism=Chromera_velia_CCMP2878 / gene_product=hypothetical protein / transcript_product=hypothetical protein / location=Cvel_scaffold895:28253-30351(-) / protein_length=266 / sequence_SO=supercontig / SO=protein_coding / is_pseudo=false